MAALEFMCLQGSLWFLGRCCTWSGLRPPDILGHMWVFWKDLGIAEPCVVKLGLVEKLNQKRGGKLSTDGSERRLLLHASP